MQTSLEDRRTLPRLTSVILTTAAVTLLPSAAAWALRSAGTVDQAPAMVLAALLSLALFYLAERCWRRRNSSTERLFSELLIWGWASRLATDRRLRSTVELLDLTRGPQRTPCALSPDRRLNLLRRVAADLEASDPYTHSHSRRVARYAALMAVEMGLTAEEVARVATAAAIHDIGKLYTPKAVLHKPGRLSEEEFEIIRRHPIDGARMVRLLVGDDELASIVLHHHERIDGTGYPGRLHGDEIPLAARIIAVADTFDAITCTRPYRVARRHQVALDILAQEAGTQLDPDAVQAFLTVYRGRRLTTTTFASLTGAFEAVLPTLGGTGVLAGLAAGAAALGSLGPAASAAPRHVPVAPTAEIPVRMFDALAPRAGSTPRRSLAQSSRRAAPTTSGLGRSVSATKPRAPVSPIHPVGNSSGNRGGTPPSSVAVRTNGVAVAMSGAEVTVSANGGVAKASLGVSPAPSPAEPGARVSAGAGGGGAGAGVSVSAPQAGGVSAAIGITPPPAVSSGVAVMTPPVP